MVRLLQIALLTFIFILSIFSTYEVNAQCTGYSFNIEDITVTSFTNSGISYNYTVRNTGSTAVSTDNLIVQNYLSSDESVGGDPAAGGGFISGSVTINPNDTYNGSYSASSINYPSYPFLRMNLQYGIQGNCQVTVDDEFECLRPDAEIVSFTINNTQSSSISYDFELKNAGGDTLFLSQLLLENFLSADNTYDGADAAAGSAAVTISGKTYLLANESGTVSFTTSGSISGYNYLIAKLTYSEQAECLTANNEEVVSIPPVSGLLSSAVTESNSIIWNTETKSFTIQNTDNAAEGTWEYHLFNSAGALRLSGNAVTGESKAIQTENGLYILVITDGKKSYSKKIIY